MNRFKSAAALICLFAVFAGSLPAQLADRSGEYNESPSQIRGMIERYSADFGSLDRFYSAPGSKNRAKRFREFYSEWLARLEKQDIATKKPSVS